jgi:hypothetical protein
MSQPGLVDFTEQGLMICGFDEYTNITIGAGNCQDDAIEGFQPVNPLVLWEANTKLEELNDPWTAKTKRGRCQIHSVAGILKDDEACSVAVTFDYADGQVGVTNTFLWATDNATRVRTDGSTLRLNDDAVATTYVDDQDACYLIGRTGNRFCFNGKQDRY